MKSLVGSYLSESSIYNGGVTFLDLLGRQSLLISLLPMVGFLMFVLLHYLWSQRL